jgi:hypothetical protein
MIWKPGNSSNGRIDRLHAHRQERNSFACEIGLEPITPTVGEPKVAVCLRRGTEVAFEANVRRELYGFSVHVFTESKRTNHS